MKKTIFALLILMLAGPVMAANVVITVVDDGNGIASINYTSDVNVRAFALNVEVTAGVNIVDVNGYFEGDCNATNKGFGIFLDQINGIDVDDEGVVDEWGSPLADACAPGPAGHGINTSKVVIGMGALYEDGNEPNHFGTLCKFRVESSCNASITAEATYRGGVVLETGSGTDPNVTGATNVAIDVDCFPLGHDDYGEWVTVGKPNCWCNKRQCHGDVDGINNEIGMGQYRWVAAADLTILISGYGGIYNGDPDAQPWICADLDHINNEIGMGQYRRVAAADLTILVDHYGAETVPDDCLD